MLFLYSRGFKCLKSRELSLSRARLWLKPDSEEQCLEKYECPLCVGTVTVLECVSLEASGGY